MGWTKVTPVWLKEEIAKLQDQIKKLETKSSPRTQVRVKNLKVQLSVAESMLKHEIEKCQ